MNKKYDMMEYKYGYANSFYGYKNNNLPVNQKRNQNLVISKNYGRFQYIPKSNNMKKTHNSFRQNAEQNSKTTKENEKRQPGIYTYGIGSSKMDSYIPIKMNGCFEDWYKPRKNENDAITEEFQVLESNSNVGINAIKKRVNSKSEKSESKSGRTKKNKKRQKW